MRWVAAVVADANDDAFRASFLRSGSPRMVRLWTSQSMLPRVRLSLPL